LGEVQYVLEGVEQALPALLNQVGVAGQWGVLGQVHLTGGRADRLGKPDDRGQGGADFVVHVRQQGGLEAVGLFDLLFGPPEGLLPTFLLGHVFEVKDRLANRPVGPPHRRAAGRKHAPGAVRPLDRALQVAHDAPHLQNLRQGAGAGGRCLLVSGRPACGGPVRVAGRRFHIGAENLFGPAICTGGRPARVDPNDRVGTRLHETVQEVALLAKGSPLGPKAGTHRPNPPEGGPLDEGHNAHGPDQRPGTRLERRGPQQCPPNRQKARQKKRQDGSHRRASQCHHAPEDGVDQKDAHRVSPGELVERGEDRGPSHDGVEQPPRDRHVAATDRVGDVRGADQGHEQSRYAEVKPAHRDWGVGTGPVQGGVQGYQDGPQQTQ